MCIGHGQPGSQLSGRLIEGEICALITGGTIIAAGTPEQVAGTPASHTGGYLKPLLAR